MAQVLQLFHLLQRPLLLHPHHHPLVHAHAHHAATVPPATLIIDIITDHHAATQVVAVVEAGIETDRVMERDTKVPPHRDDIHIHIHIHIDPESDGGVEVEVEVVVRTEILKRKASSERKQRKKTKLA